MICRESIEFSSEVYKELETDSIRDQISAPYVVWKRREAGDEGILTITESFTAHKGQLPFEKSKIFASGGDKNGANNVGVPVGKVKIGLFIGTAVASTVFATIQVLDAGSADTY